MKVLVRNKLLVFISVISFLFFLGIAFDVSPLLRGPFDPILDSQWPYYFVNTFSKIYAPIIPFVIMGYLFFKFDKYKTLNRKQEIFFLLSIVVLSFLLQIALVHFSRFGITILFRRLVDPGINGYFSTARQIGHITDFLSTFNTMQPTFDQHARGHFPGVVVFLKILLDFFDYLLTPFHAQLEVLNRINVGWAKELWIPLTISQKFSALVIPFLIHLITSITLLPFYLLAKSIGKTNQAAMKSTALYLLCPSFAFFALIFNPIYAVFPVLSILFIALAIKKSKSFYILLSGISFGIGLFFTLSILPILFALLVFTVLSLTWKNIFQTTLYLFHFLWGMGLVIFFVSLFGFDWVKSFFVIIGGQAPRDYILWVIFNPYDFFLFLGIPTSILFFASTYKLLRSNTENIVHNRIVISFWITFIILVLYGISRGEVGRIWIPFMFVPIIFSAIYSERFSTKQFLIVITLLFVQLIILEEFWVPIW